jgi:hypothetical protein
MSVPGSKVLALETFCVRLTLMLPWPEVAAWDEVGLEQLIRSPRANGIEIKSFLINVE